MKNLLVLAVVATTLPALAQSSVTVAGVADAAVRHVKNDGLGANSSLVSGSNSTSKFIVRGTEDLGGGLSAGFYLEHGFTIGNGTAVQATQFWDRRSTVSLVSKAFGEVRAGRDLVPSYANWNRFDPFSYVGAAGANNLVSATPLGPIRSAFGSAPNTTVRTNHAVQWFLPGGWWGFEGGLLATSTEDGTAANGINKVRGARLGWSNGRLLVSGASTRTENNLTTAGKFADDAVGAAYDFGLLRVTAGMRRFEYAAARQTNLLFGANVPLARGELRVSVNQSDFDGRVGTTDISANGATQVGLGYVHNLSKRSALYATASYITNKGTQATVVPGGTAGMAGGGSSRGVEAGLRHNF